MHLIQHWRFILPLINIIVHSVSSFPNISPSSITFLDDTIFNQIFSEQDLIVHENGGVVFARVGSYHEPDDIFALSATVPVTSVSNDRVYPAEQSVRTLCFLKIHFVFL